MTSTPVTGLDNSVLMNYKTQTQSMDLTGTSDFKSFMDSSKASLKTDESKTLKKNDTVSKETDKTEADDKPMETKEVSDKKPKKCEEVTKNVKDEDVSRVEKAINEVLEEISEELDVSLEDIEAALETLGLTTLALLDAEKLPEIVAQIFGLEDTISLATDDAAYEGLLNITDSVKETVEELCKDVEIPAEEFKEALKVNEEPAKEKVSLNNEEPAKEKVSLNNEEAANENVSLNEEPKHFEEKITVSDNRKEHTYEGGADNSLETKEVEAFKIEVSREFDGEDNKGFNPDTNSQQNPLSFAEKLLERVTEALNKESETVSYTSFDAQNILDQITESIKVDVSSETSEINLKLHPESLGTVSVKVLTNSEGVLTAEFRAQNDAVKAVIESQAVVLKEALEAKGVTVEAVEVLVQSHQFDRNLSDQSKGYNEEAPKKRGLRRINLSDEMALEETEDSEDTLVKEMMAQNGNTIDYSA